MKNLIKSIILLGASLCLFSCSDDDDGGSGTLQPGWTQEIIDEAVEDCVDEGGSEENCSCSILTTAQNFTLDEIDSDEGLSTEQTLQLAALIVEECGEDALIDIQ